MTLTRVRGATLAPFTAGLITVAWTPPAEALVVAVSRLEEIQQEQDRLRPKLVARGAVVVAELRRLANAIQVQVPRGQPAAAAQMPRLHPPPRDKPLDRRPSPQA